MEPAPSLACNDASISSGPENFTEPLIDFLYGDGDESGYEN